MKIVIKFLKIVAILIVLLFVVSFFLPNKVHVERSIVVQADTAKVFSYLYDLKEWNKWSPWHELDTNAIIAYQNNGLGVGGSFTWKSENKEVGEGKMLITAVEQNKQVNYTISFVGMGTSYSAIQIQPENNQTKVTWKFDSNTDDAPLLMRPISKYFGLFMDKMIGADFERGLKKLSSLVSK